MMPKREKGSQRIVQLMTIKASYESFSLVSFASHLSLIGKITNPKVNEKTSQPMQKPKGIPAMPVSGFLGSIVSKIKNHVDPAQALSVNIMLPITSKE